MTTLTELTERVWSQTETSSAEVPAETINRWLNEAFQRTISAETQWPFFQHAWQIVQSANQVTAALPGDLPIAGIVSLISATGRRLELVNEATAEDAYIGTAGASGYPSEFSVWGDTITFWPQVSQSTDQEYRMRGYRQPVAWSSLTPADSPDCDERLHNCLAHYATALAYAQQEDETLETTYMERWQRDAEIARSAIMTPAQARPLIFGPQYVDARVGPRSTRIVAVVQTP